MIPAYQPMIDDYIRRLRRGMRGASADLREEAVLEIRAHIDDALGGLAAPSESDILDVLDRLGRPEDYGRDMALYMMVDRGYHDWSLPHMLRSTAFWALTTLTGAVVVPIFAALYALAAILLASGLVGMLSHAGLFGATPWAKGLSLGLPAPAALLAGLVAMGLLTALVRWFVGQYVRHAGPQLERGDLSGDDEAWSRRAERRILLTAGAGLALNLLAGFASGIYAIRGEEGGGLLTQLPPDFGASPLARLSGLGLLLLALAPIIGAVWSSSRGARRPR